MIVVSIRRAYFSEDVPVRFRLFIKDVPFWIFMKGMPAFLIAYGRLRRQVREAEDVFPFGKLHPCLEDNRASGSATGHYFHQDLLVARRIFKNNPTRHVDIGSRIDGFVAHVASFREIEVFDIRALGSPIPNVIFRQFDLMDKNFPLKDYCDSVSCLHALEHFGLGRYGDRLDYFGYLQGWENIYAMLQQGGKFYFSVPIGAQRIEFNAHRVFSLPYLLNMIEAKYRIDSFSYVDDKGNLVTDARLEEEAVRKNFFCHYGCGIFELTKK